MAARLTFSCVFLVSLAASEADAPARPPADIFKPDWLVSFFPAKLLVLPLTGTTEVQDQFHDALARVQSATSATLVDFPKGQPRPKEKNKERLKGWELRSGDAGYIVLVSQTGRVAALYVAFSSNKDWAKEVAKNIADLTFEPAKIDGKPVPFLICRHWTLDHRININ